MSYARWKILPEKWKNMNTSIIQISVSPDLYLMALEKMNSCRWITLKRNSMLQIYDTRIWTWNGLFFKQELWLIWCSWDLLVSLREFFVVKCKTSGQMADWRNLLYLTVQWNSCVNIWVQFVRLVYVWMQIAFATMAQRHSCK